MFAIVSEAPSTCHKREQRATGMKQLRHSLKLLQSLAPPGDKIVYLCPVLVFVAQRTLRVSRVTRLVPQKVSGNITAVVRMLQSLSTYTVPMEPRTQRARRRRGGAARGSASRPKRSHSGARDPPEPAARQVPPADQTPASTEGGGVLKRIAALFCVPVATKTKPRAASE